jgi:hypothetical protein
MHMDLVYTVNDCEQVTLNPQLGVAIISRIACGTPNLSKKKIKKNDRLT